MNQQQPPGSSWPYPQQGDPQQPGWPGSASSAPGQQGGPGQQGQWPRQGGQSGPSQQPPYGPGQQPQYGPVPASHPGHPSPTGGPSQQSAPTDQSGSGPSGVQMTRILLHILCPLLIITGISAPLDGEGTVMWTSEPTWAALTVIAALVQLAGAFGTHQLSGHGWTIAAAATGVLLLTWTLIFLPGVASNRGFMVTLGVAAAGVAVWLSPDRRQLT